ncbi:hypothetical protein ACFU76_19340 [Streptomyces sp. NPDC057539]|uniref:hypothetical protein n=1 Tax=Streptomyces sp. NPDC057539 TaxID=3346159 RepID=UPI0036B70395
MTQCPGGGRDFPMQDEDGARCDEHGITLRWNGPPIAEDDLPSTPGAPVPERRGTVSERAQQVLYVVVLVVLLVVLTVAIGLTAGPRSGGS